MPEHSKEFRIEVAKAHLGGLTPTQVSRRYGVCASLITKWSSYYKVHGEKGFIKLNLQRSPEEKLAILEHMWSNFWSVRQTCIHFNIPSVSSIRGWEKKYKEEGLAGLKRKCPGARVVKSHKQRAYDKSLKSVEKMSVAELRKEVEYRRAEIAVVKKLEALMRSGVIKTETKSPS